MQDSRNFDEVDRGVSVTVRPEIFVGVVELVEAVLVDTTTDCTLMIDPDGIAVVGTVVAAVTAEDPLA